MGGLELVASEALVFETEQDPNPTRKRYAFRVLSKAKFFIRTDVGVETRARDLVSRGIRTLDALHLASAEAIQTDFFCNAMTDS